MYRVHFFRIQEAQRTWAMTVCPPNSNTKDSGYFRSMAAISFSRILQDTYGLNATIKKIISSRDPMFCVLVSFDNDEDEDLFIVKSSNGLEI